MKPIPLASLTPREQLRAGKLPSRLVRLFVGLTLYGLAMAIFVRAGFGLDPWDVFHYGVAEHLGLDLGTAVILVSIPVLLLWIPLRQWPGFGTISNAIWIGIATNISLALIPTPHNVVVRVVLLLTAVVVNAIGGALYIGSQLGPGPRDGLMTGLHLRTGLSLRLVRTSLELTVLVVGWLLGGIVGIGTLLYALSIGPLVQFFLRYLVVPLDEPVRRTQTTPTTTPCAPGPPPVSAHPDPCSATPRARD
ncbi:membrane protein YczE [Flexivirga sp. B27]